MTSGLDLFTARWARAVADAGPSSMTSAQVSALLGELAQQLSRALRSTPFDPSAGYRVGAALVAADLTGPAAIERSVCALARLPADLGYADSEVHERLPRLQGALAAGYAEALGLRTRREQEAIGREALDARREAERALRESEARFRTVFAGTAIAISIGDTTGRVLAVNPAFCALLGYSEEEFRGGKISDFLHPDDLPVVQETISRDLVCGAEDRVVLDTRFLRKDGEVVWAHVGVCLVRDEAGAPNCLVALGEDVTERHDLQERLTYQARHDPLTGLPNRALFLTRLTEVYDDAPDSQRVGLCLVDLDGFAQFNDSLGHEVGDLVLVLAAERLAGCVAGPGHVLARLGGDEFAVLIPDAAGSAEVVELARRILSAFAEPVAVGDHRLSVGVSIGVVDRTVGEHGGGVPLIGQIENSEPAHLMCAAHLALSWAKADGRRRWAAFDPERQAREMTRHALAAMIPAAVEHHEFLVEYQPLVALPDGRLRGAEALVRWRHPTLGLLEPEQFIGLAEESDAIVTLGRQVMQQAIAEAAGWCRARRAGEEPVYVSVNVSARQVGEPQLVEDVLATLEECGLEARLLHLEITESAVLGPAAHAVSTLLRLSEAGVRIAVDDFGTGYSNLAYLRDLPVHELKLASRFVHGLHPSDPAGSVDERIVAALVSLAHTLGLVVIAEGVETRAQAERLRALGCDLAQGTLLAAPCPPEQMARLLRSGDRLGPV